MQTVQKFRLTLDDEQTLSMPRDARILTVQNQQGKPTLWACVDADLPIVARRFLVCATGQPISETPDMIYVATFQAYAGALVYHVFDLGEESGSG